MPTATHTIFTPSLGKVLFERSTQALLVVGESGKIEYSNPSTWGLLGYNELELNGKDVAEIFAADDSILISGVLSSIFNEEKVIERKQVQVVESNNTKRKVNITFSRFSGNDASKLLLAMRAAVTEEESGIELKRLNIELERHIREKNESVKANQELYHIVSRNFPNGVISVFDSNFNYLFAEGKELYNMGITSEKLVGTNYLERLPRSIHGEISERLSEVLKGRNQTFEISFEQTHYILNATGLKDDNGEINRILLVEINNTNQKRAEEEVKKAFEKERQLNELKSRFVSMASHEFRTPLSTILSSINLMFKYMALPDSQEKIEKHGNKIRSSVKNLTSILNDFLSIDKLEEGKVEYNPNEFDLCELVQQMAEDLEEQLKDGQEFQLVLPRELLIYQDKNIFRNILLNLFTNAIKYSDENQEIMVKLWQLGKNVFLEVQDEGIGIPEEEQSQLFERFFRAKNAFNLQGTGLGLNIVQRYVELIKGKISFISKEQEGSTFTISFPKKYNDEEDSGN